MAFHSFMLQAEKIICKGPTEDFNGFLEAFDQLISIKMNETNESANKDADRLVGDAIEKMKDEFNKMLIDHRFYFILFFLSITINFV